MDDSLQVTPAATVTSAAQAKQATSSAVEVKKAATPALMPETATPAASEAVSPSQCFYQRRLSIRM